MFLLGGLIGGGAMAAVLHGTQWNRRGTQRTVTPPVQVVSSHGENDGTGEWEWTVNLLGIFTECSSSGDILGYDPAELVGRSIDSIMDPQELTRASAMVQATGIPDDGLSQLVAPVRHRDGTTRWGETTVRILTDPDGAVIGYQGRSRLIGSEAALVVTTEHTRSRVQAMLADRLLMTSFQPIVELATSRVMGVEALSRFVAEPGDLPEAWFTDATRVGMGPELELLAIATALTAAVDLPEYLYVSINVSPLTCLDHRVEDLIRQSGIDLARIVLELTEHTEVTDYKVLNETLQGLRRSGVKIAVDDAGAGFASGQHILKIRPDIIKIDRGLITGIDTDLGVRTLAAGMVAMADQIGATVTAEGIETRAELKCVTKLGILAGQGYLLGRPSVTPTEWAAWNADVVIRPAPESVTERTDPLASHSAELAPSFAFSAAMLDALPDATAILDATGRIIAVNKAWRMFTEDNAGNPLLTGVGVSYLEVCERAASAGLRDAVEVLSGLRAVLAREAVEREWDYACSSPSVKRWFICRITGIDDAHGGAVVSHVNISRRKRAEQELAHEASHDSLTGLANRLLFTRTLTETLQRRTGREQHADVGLLYVDLDDFKPVNDAFGHAAGDELLLMTTHRLRVNIRPQDTVARLGGDEFAVCAPRITADGLAALAARIAAALGEPVKIHGQQLHVSASVGVHLAAAGESAADALHAADVSMYKVKGARSRRQSLVP
jgi:diguanylate cyclase (GGDEF)-like protein/PAS domain S-box-containing protein